jgi:hypothetical protein
MIQLTWIDSVRDETWLPGLRAANLLLRADYPVLMASAASASEPYLAVADLPPAVARRLRERGVTLIEEHPAEPSPAELTALRPPRVAVFGGAGSPYNHASALAELGVAWFYVTGAEVAAGALAGADLLLVPGGGWRHGNGQLQDLGTAGVRAINQFVEAGGGYLASCAGSLIAMRVPEAALPALDPAKAELTLLEVENWDRLRQAEGGHRSPGIGRVRTRLPEPRHPVALGLPDQVEMTHYNGPIFAEPDTALAVVVRYDGVTEGFTPSEYFFGHRDRPTPAERGDSDMAEAGALALPAVVAGDRGRGRVVLAGLHPEFGRDEALDQWGRPVQLIANAVLWIAQRGCGAGVPAGQSTASLAEADLDGAEHRLLRAIDHGRHSALALQAINQRATPDWLDHPDLRAAFGLTPAELWQGTVESLDSRSDRVAKAWDGARQAARGSQQTRLVAAVDQRYEPPHGPDLGAQGALWLVEEATRLIADAAGLLGDHGASRSDAELRVSRSYLSAVGVLTNAAQRLEAEAASYAAEAEVAALSA